MRRPRRFMRGVHLALSLLFLNGVVCKADDAVPRGGGDLQRELSEKLSASLRAFPRGSFHFEYLSESEPLAEDAAIVTRRAMEATALDALRSDHSIFGRDLEDRAAEVKQSASIVSQCIASAALATLRGPLDFDFVGSDAQIERIGSLLDGEDDRVLGNILVTTQFGASGIVNVLNQGPEANPEHQRRVDVQRLRRVEDDIVQYDASRYMDVARRLPREVLTELTAHPLEWQADASADVVEIRYVVRPSSRTPAITLDPGLVSGEVKIVASRSDGLLRSLEVVDASGFRVEYIKWDRYVSDASGALPLQISHESWLPGSGRRFIHEYFDGKVVDSRPLRSIDQLIPEGALVMDLRVTPAIRYTRHGPLPDDTNLAVQSAEVAKHDVLGHAAATTPTTLSGQITSPLLKRRRNWRPLWTPLAWAAVGLAAIGVLLRFVARRRRGTSPNAGVLAKAGVIALLLAIPAGSSAGVFAWRQSQDHGQGLIPSGDVLLGTVDRGIELPFSMTVGNDSDEEVCVEHLYTTCGCTQVKYDSRLVPVGGILSIHGLVDTSSPGRRQAIVYVQFNGESAPVRVGRVEATVRSGWVSRQTGVSLKLDDPGTLDSRIQFTSDDSRVPTSASCSTDLEFVKTRSSLAGRVLTIEFESDKASTPLGSYSARVIVESDSRGAPHFESHLRVEYQAERVRTTPSTLTSPLERLSSSVRLPFRVAVDGRPLPVREARSLDPKIATVVAVRQSDNGRIELEIAPAADLGRTNIARILLLSGVANVIVEVIIATGKSDDLGLGDR